MKPQLALLRTGGVHSRTFESIIAWLTSPNRNKWAFTAGQPDADVVRSRSIIATDFLQRTDNDVLVMMDYDIDLVNPGDLDYLAEKAAETQGIVGAVISVKAIGQGFGCRFVDDTPHELLSDELVRLVPPAYMGGALTAYHRSVFEAMIKAGMRYCAPQGLYPFFAPTVVYNEDLGEWDYLSEDWACCQYAHEAGKPIYAAMRPFALHHGAAAFSPLTGNPDPEAK